MLTLQTKMKNSALRNDGSRFQFDAEIDRLSPVKGDEEIADPAADNIKKHEYAMDHFKRLNQWLEKAKIPARYQFNMISPKSYNVFFQKLRDGGIVDFRSVLDVAMTKAAKVGGYGSSEFQ